MIEKEALQRKYLKEHKTIDEISRCFGVSQYPIRYWMKRHNIRNIERWERYGLKEFNQKQREYLYGSLLGDDTLRMPTDGRYPFLAVSHGYKQKEYLEWKYGIWKQIVPGSIRIVRLKLKNGKTYQAYKFTTATHPDFLEFYNLFYKNNKKRITKEILNELTPFSVAVWYMDDGYYRRSRGRAQLSTNSFSYKENLLIQRYFNEAWAISSNMGVSDNGTNYIWFNTENTIKFFKIIKDYIIPYFNYKIDLERKVLWQRIPEKDLQYIKSNYNIESPRLIAYKLDRSIGSIHNTAFKLGLTKPRGGRKYYKYDL